MNSHLTVSVVMPACNVASYTGEALESKFAQTFTDIEVPVVTFGTARALPVCLHLE